jgi:hypothetical protein
MPLENVFYTTMATLGLLHVDSVELPHTMAEVSIVHFDEEVVMIAHKAISTP